MEFFQTRIGQTFYEGTMPGIKKALGEISEELKKANDLKIKELELKERELKLREEELKR